MGMCGGFFIHICVCILRIYWIVIVLLLNGIKEGLLACSSFLCYSMQEEQPAAGSFVW